MIDGLLPPGLARPSGSERVPDSPEKVREAAREFEALLLGQMLKSMRESGSGGWLGAGEDASSDSLMELAEQQMGKLLAAGGGLGLANLAARGLSNQEPQTPPPRNR